MKYHRKPRPLHLLPPEAVLHLLFHHPAAPPTRVVNWARRAAEPYLFNPCIHRSKVRITTMNPALEIHSHVVIDSNGCAWIDDSNIKVMEVVRDHIAYGWSPEEIHWQHPHLGLAQIYAALAYYHDNRAAMDAEIQGSLETANTAARLAADSPIARRLQGISRG
jgi:uncharacterized protein (DUF433 family)